MSRSSGGKERKVIRSRGGEEELSAVSSKSKKIKKPQAFAPDGLLQMRAQLSRMETRIETVEEELRLEKQKNAALLQQSHLSPSLNPAQSCQDNPPTVSERSCNGKKAKTAPVSGSGEDFKTKEELKKRNSQDGLERKRSLGEERDDQLVTPVKRRKQQEENGGGLGRCRGVLSTPTSPRPRGGLSSPKKPGCAVGSPTRSTRGGR